MKEHLELFFETNPSAATDPTYCALRDGISPEARQAKKFAERLWEAFWADADPHFVSEIARSFQARFWEMYLTCAVRDNLSQTATVTSSGHGPDIQVDLDGRRIWMEAVTATAGDPTKPDSLVAPPEDVVYNMPLDQIILRFTSVIADKHKKLLGYKQHRIVAEDDPYIIAVNDAFPFAFRRAGSEIPLILKTVLPTGAPQMTIDKESGTARSIDHQYRPHIIKRGARVATAMFCNPDFSGISGVLHSHAEVSMSNTPLGADFVFVHNTMAKNPAPRRFLSFWEEYVVDESGGLLEISRI